MFKRKDERISITAAELQYAIQQALHAAPSCEDFVGVVVRPKTPKSRSEPNWDVRGIKFGKADRIIVSEALAKVVARLQQEFRLTGNTAPY
jgi:hypothetical protein